MCGIVGLISKPGGRLVYSNIEIKRMMDRQKHRGPDDEGIIGFKRDDSVFFDISTEEENKCVCDGVAGFNRLSIRDLSKLGHQPMVSMEAGVSISFNGEIYNAEEIKQSLKMKGYRFKGRSDTEVILNAYIEYGVEKLLQMLNGMFAIVIVDLRLKMVFLMRDRFGIKPIYYTFTNNYFAWASEMKSFLEVPDFKRELDLESVNEHLTFLKPYNSILYRNVDIIEPGTYMTLNLLDFSTRKIKYYDVDLYERPACTERTLDDYMEECESLLIKCVEHQKVSDAKVGCQLSGGIDSTLITYFAANNGSNRLKDTISIIFDGKEKNYSEEAFVDWIGQKVAIETHKEIISEHYFIRNIEKACYHADSVLGRPNAIGLMLLAKKAKQYVTVLLSGEGADELSGGYAMFPKGELFLRTNPTEQEKAEYAVCTQQKTDMCTVEKLLPNYMGNALLQNRREVFSSLNGTFFDKQIKYALKTYLPELLLCQDKVSMANSIENRVPFLDNEFVDFMFSVPKKHLLWISKQVQTLDDYKDVSEDTTGKFLLKKVSEKNFGHEFAFRRKMGFGIPYYRYFKRSEIFRDYYYDCILPGIKKRGIIDSQAVEQLYDKLGTCGYENNELFWKAVNLEIWCQIFLDGRSYQKIG